MRGDILKVHGTIWKPSKKIRWRRIKPFGLCVHTTGRGILAKAKRNGIEPIAQALKYYKNTGAVHFVVDYDGTVYQMLKTNRRGAHIGISKYERKQYLSGRWVQEVSVGGLSHWLTRWKEKSPQHLYPTKSPNACYIGVELLPLAYTNKEGHWFTQEQHEAVALLYKKLALTYHWPLCVEAPHKQFLGHEDVDAYARWQNSGAWDPGAMRKFPRFSWEKVNISLV